LIWASMISTLPMSHLTLQSISELPIPGASSASGLFSEVCGSFSKKSRRPVGQVCATRCKHDAWNPPWTPACFAWFRARTAASRRSSSGED
jgi:hypothetical protein